MDFCTALHEYSQVLDGMLQIHGIPRDCIQFYVILDDLKLSLTSSRSPLWQPSSPWQVFKRYVINFDKDLPQLRTNSNEKHGLRTNTHPDFRYLFVAFQNCGVPMSFCLQAKNLKCHRLTLLHLAACGWGISRPREGCLPAAVPSGSPLRCWCGSRRKGHLGNPNEVTASYGYGELPECFRLLYAFVTCTKRYKEYLVIFGVCLGCFRMFPLYRRLWLLLLLLLLRLLPPPSFFFFFLFFVVFLVPMCSCCFCCGVVCGFLVFLEFLCCVASSKNTHGKYTTCPLLIRGFGWKDVSHVPTSTSRDQLPLCRWNRHGQALDMILEKMKADQFPFDKAELMVSWRPSFLQWKIEMQTSTGTDVSRRSFAFVLSMNSLMDSFEPVTLFPAQAWMILNKIWHNLRWHHDFFLFCQLQDRPIVSQSPIAWPGPGHFRQWPAAWVPWRMAQ